MSNYVFPTLPGLGVEFGRSNVDKVNVYENPGGTEQRVSLYSQPRHQYDLRMTLRATKVVSAPGQPWDGYTEPAVLLYFWDTHHGPWDSFYFVDPLDSVQRRVRFVEDSLSLRRNNSVYWWDASFGFIEVAA